MSYPVILKHKSWTSSDLFYLIHKPEMNQGIIKTYLINAFFQTV